MSSHTEAFCGLLSSSSQKIFEGESIGSCPLVNFDQMSFTETLNGHILDEDDSQTTILESGLSSESIQSRNTIESAYLAEPTCYVYQCGDEEDEEKQLCSNINNEVCEDGDRIKPETTKEIENCNDTNVPVAHAEQTNENTFPSHLTLVGVPEEEVNSERMEEPSKIVKFKGSTNVKKRRGQGIKFLALKYIPRSLVSLQNYSKRITVLNSKLSESNSRFRQELCMMRTKYQILTEEADAEKEAYFQRTVAINSSLTEGLEYIKSEQEKSDEENQKLKSILFELYDEFVKLLQRYKDAASKLHSSEQNLLKMLEYNKLVLKEFKAMADCYKTLKNQYDKTKLLNSNMELTLSKVKESSELKKNEGVIRTTVLNRPRALPDLSSGDGKRLVKEEKRFKEEEITHSVSGHHSGYSKLKEKLRFPKSDLSSNEERLEIVQSCSSPELVGAPKKHILKKLVLLRNICSSLLKDSGEFFKQKAALNQQINSLEKLSEQRLNENIVLSEKIERIQKKTVEQKEEITMLRSRVHSYETKLMACKCEKLERIVKKKEKKIEQLINYFKQYPHHATKKASHNLLISDHYKHQTWMRRLWPLQRDNKNN